MRHVAPHRFADAWAGKLADDERAAIERHVAECPACARVRERVTRASDTFSTIKNQQPPELGWDSVRAKVHWSVSTERRAKIDPRAISFWPRRRLGMIAAGAVAAAGVAAIVLVPPKHVTEPTVTPVAFTPPVPTEPIALSGIVNRTTGDLMIDGIRPVDPFTLHLVAGTVIATGDGRVDVQFGAASAFGLGPHSRLELVKLDSRAIEFAVDGLIDVEVAPRLPGQTFIVHAGTRSIEVRGTQFRVDHTSAGTTVECRHGLVAVHDLGSKVDDQSVTVGTARRVDLGGSRDHHVVPMSIEEVTELADATPMTMPVWEPATLANSAPLAIATAGRRAVRLDGVEIGDAPMRIRVMPGRHTVDATDNQGRYRRAGWIDVAAPAAHALPARLEILPEPTTTRQGEGSAIRERRAQLRAGLDHGKLAACTRAAAKQGLVAGAYVQIEISVDGQGAVGFLNVLETDLPHKLADCIHGVLTDVRFTAGAAASWRERIDL